MKFSDFNEKQCPPPCECILMDLSNRDPELVARESYIRAINLLKEINTNGNEELNLRQVLNEYLKCFWFYKKEREVIAKAMHEIGINLEKKYNCKWKFDGKFYYTECPNILLHNDFGFSLRGTQKLVCSICNDDPLNCEHITNEIYDNVVCSEISGLCNICGSVIHECDHVLGYKYDDVKAKTIVKDLKIITFDLVKDPEMVFCRMTRINLSKKEILDKLCCDEKIDFKYGISDLFCHHCTTCPGYDPSRIDVLFEKK